MLQSLGLCASLAALAQAIMIPSTVSLDSLSGAGGKHGSLALVDPYTQVLQVGCPGCMFAQSTTEREEGFMWIQGVANNLLLNISVGNSPETLELNGVRFYPPIMSLTTEPPVPYISQVPAGHSLAEIRQRQNDLTSKPLRLTSWSFAAATSHTVNESGEEILTITLQLNALERQAVTVPDITITALKNTDAQLMLLKIDTAQALNKAHQCNDWPLLCKWRAIVASRLRGFRGNKAHGCHKRPHSGDRGHHHGGFGGMHHGGGHMGQMGHSRPHHGVHHGHGHRHGHHFYFHPIVRMIGRTLLVLGAMIVVVTLIVKRACSNRTRNYVPVALEDEHDVPRKSLEKAIYVDEEAIAAPPVYVEVEAKELVQ
jgi:hypothetical protein